MALKIHYCSECGYDLSGLRHFGQCPECGNRFNIERWEGVADHRSPRHGHGRVSATTAGQVTMGLSIAILLGAIVVAVIKDTRIPLVLAIVPVVFLAWLAVKIYRA